MQSKRLTTMGRLAMLLALLLSSGPVAAHEAYAPAGGQTQSVAAVGLLSILWSQNDNPGGNVANSSDYPISDFLDAQAADDFIIPTGTSGTWNIDRITVDGSYADPNLATGVNVYFYQDGGGLPGMGVYTATNLTPSSGLATGDFVIDLPAPLTTLARGTTYWVSVQAVMPNSSTARWQWTERTVLSNNPSAWRSPAGLLKPQCKDWGIRAGEANCDQPVASSGPDLIFTIEGTSTIGGAGPLIFNTSPTSAAGGSPDTQLTVNGANFGDSDAAGAVVKWNGAPLSTTWFNSSRLFATIPAANLAVPGTYTITVSVGAQNSNPYLFNVGNIRLYLPLIRR